MRQLPTSRPVARRRAVHAASPAGLHAIAVGQVLQQLRARDRAAQLWIARRAGVSQSRPSRIESGRALPDAYELHQLTLAVGTTVAVLERSTDLVESRAAALAGLFLEQVGASGWADHVLDVAGRVGLVALVRYAAAETLRLRKRS